MPRHGSMRQSARLSITSQLVEGLQLFRDISTGMFRPLVLSALRHAVFHSLNELAHPGRHATRRLVSSCFVWPGLAKQVTAWASQCLAFQRGKVTRHVHMLPEPIAMCQTDVFPASKWTSSDHCQLQVEPRACSPSSTGPLGGRRHSWWRTHWPPHASGYCWRNGWQVLACKTSSHLTEVPKSPRACDMLCAAH